MQHLRSFLGSVTNKSILVILPHPDDESFAMGGLFLLANKLGFTTHLVCMTKGEQGNSTTSKGDELAKLRATELQAAARILRISSLTQLDFPDTQLREHVGEMGREVTTLIKEIDPGIVLTYDHGGFTGHPDHIALSVTIKDVCLRLGHKLLFYVPPQILRKVIHNPAEGFSSTPEFTLLNFFNFRKSIAFSSHKSQMSKSSLPYKLAVNLLLAMIPENYHLVDFTREYQHKYFPFEIN